MGLGVAAWKSKPAASSLGSLKPKYRAMLRTTAVLTSC